MTEQEKVIAEMNVSIAAAAKLTTTLRFKGESEAADNIAEKREEMIRLTENLLAKAFEDWGSSIETVTSELADANKEIEGVIKNIKKKVKTADQIVKAVEKLDGIIEKVTKFIA